MCHLRIVGWRRFPLLRVIIFIRQCEPQADDSPATLRRPHKVGDALFFHPLHAREKRPLVGKRHQRSIHEDAVSIFTRRFLQWQRDEVAEAAVWQRVLVGKETVVGFQADFWAAIHRLGEDVCAEFAGGGCGDCVGEENPDMPANAERERSSAAGTSSRAHVSKYASASSRQRSPSKSTARNQQRSSRSIGYTPMTNGSPRSSAPERCQRTTSSETGSYA